MDSYTFPIVLKSGLFFTMILIAFCLAIPQTFNLYLKWQFNKKDTSFSAFLLMASFSCMFLITTYPMFLIESLRLHQTLMGDWTKFLTDGIVIFFFLFISGPKILYYYRKLKENKSPARFSFFCFFIFISFYCISFLSVHPIKLSLLSL